MSGGFREKSIEAGRELIPSLGFVAATGANSGGGDGVSGGGVCRLGGVWMGVTLRDDLLLSLPDSWFLELPQVDINERTGEHRCKNCGQHCPNVAEGAGADLPSTYHASGP